MTNPNESIDTVYVYPADKTSFVPRCPKLNSLIVGDMVTLGPGPAHIFSPYIRDNSTLSLVMVTGVSPEPRVHVSPVRAPERN